MITIFHKTGKLCKAFHGNRWHLGFSVEKIPTLWEGVFARKERNLRRV